MTREPAARLSAAVLFFAVAVGGSGVADADEPIGHKPTVWANKSFAKHRAEAMKLGSEYRTFIASYKTEREVVKAALELAQRAGHRNLLAPARRGKLRPGTRFYAVAHGKLAAVGVIGSKPLRDGVHVVATHVDAVRIDLKQNALYADGNMALFQTHYYGGIKGYQWLSQPLELRGVVVTKAGKSIRVSIGAKPSDPVFVIPDVAVHVAWQVDREEGEDVPGERLDPLVSSTPAANAKAGTDPFAAEAERLLKARYGFTAADLMSAELELVPAAAPRDVGIDRAVIGGYGQDDRACSYAALRAVLAVGTPQHTAIVVLADKEEIGSTGNTGAQSSFFRRVVAELVDQTGGTSTTAAVDAALANSIVFSADVTGAVNPHYTELYEKKNASFLGSGVVWDQTGVHAELLSYVRTLLDRNGIVHQPSTWTKSRRSKSESGTVLPYFTRFGMNGIEVSIPLLSMHSPFELVSKADLFEGYRAYRAFLSD